MNLNTTIADLLTAALTSTPAQRDSPSALGSDMIGKQVIVRTTGAGVLYGKLTEISGSTVRLADARQLWRWESTDRLALTDLATLGTPLGAGTKFSGAAAEAIVNDVHVVLLCTPEATRVIDGVSAWG